MGSMAPANREVVLNASQGSRLRGREHAVDSERSWSRSKSRPMLGEVALAIHRGVCVSAGLHKGEWSWQVFQSESFRRRWADSETLSAGLRRLRDCPEGAGIALRIEE